jgi:hypothetical protein
MFRQRPGFIEHMVRVAEEIPAYMLKYMLAIYHAPNMSASLTVSKPPSFSEASANTCRKVHPCKLNVVSRWKCTNTGL